MKAFQKHPFAVRAHFDQSLVLTYAVPIDELRPLIPAALQLDTYQDKYAFLALAIVQTRDLRPKGFPPFLGRAFTLIGYRAFVRYQGSDGRTRRGLYILRSETNSPWMTFTGNIFTHYNYVTVSLDWQKNNDGSQKITSDLGLCVAAAAPSPDVKLPPQSPFPDWRQARRFAGPMPFTFTYDSQSQTMISVEGVRQEWKPQPLEVLEHHCPFFDQLNLSERLLANAFLVQNIPYLWKKGTIESCPCP